MIFSPMATLEWGTDWADGDVEIEKNIMHFKTENSLHVSYSKDTPKVRAQ